MSSSPKIGDLVEIPPVRTVIRLEEGRLKSAEIAESFVFTDEVSSHCAVLSDALLKGSGQGYFLQGDFGSGKSHFLAAIYALLAGNKANLVLGRRHSGLKRFKESGKKILPVDISLINYRSATPLERIILEAVENTLAEHGTKTDIQALSSAKERHETFIQVIEAVKTAGFDGLILLIDELSEFFRSKPSTRALNEDARTLQLIGEMASKKPLWIIAAVQESIEKTGDISLSIFRKIKDRFPIKFSLSTVHIRSLISGRLVKRKPGADDEIYRIYEHYKQQFPTFSCSYDDFRSTYPVHPTTISLLDGLGELFSQHRGIVDFVYSRIAGDSRRRIPSILERPGLELLAPDSIYEHFAGRLAEVSAFNIYPRHIIPHLDEVIDKAIENSEDRPLARRLVRMLVLYRIHPTAAEPAAAELSELSACSLGFQSPDFSAQFISETLLDPIALNSRFLIKKITESTDPKEAVYTIITEDDPGKTLDARLKRTAGDIDAEDSRLLTEPLRYLPESESWPGKSLLAEGTLRSINWYSSTRRVIVRFLHKDDDTSFSDRLSQDISNNEIDFAVVLTIVSGGQGGSGNVDSEHTAVWQIKIPEKSVALNEFLAAVICSNELNPSNPAEAPLISPVKERIQRLKPLACQAVLEALYSGSFTDPGIRVDPAVRQLKRFDRLLESAAVVVLDNRYPRFREVAPRRFIPSTRIYQQLLEEFIIPGSLSLQEARARSLSIAIDGLAVPLGMVEMKRGSYLFSPDTEGHALLSLFFSLLRPSGFTPFSEVLSRLSTGIFGLPSDTALFLIVSLAAGGLIAVRKNGRALPLEYLNMFSLEKADEIALGELINEHDRDTLITECTFLVSASGLESFGLQQQREIWKEIIKLKETAQTITEDTRSRLSELSEFSSFRAFNIPTLEQKLNALSGLIKEIKVSYSVKEGLEKFLKTWRGTGLKADDILLIRKLNKFLDQNAEEFVFINHYIHHPCVEKAAARDSTLADLKHAVQSLLEEPETCVVNDSGAHLGSVFSHFRSHYSSFYSKLHAEYYKSCLKPALSKNAVRALSSLVRLSEIETLDRPPGLDKFLKEISVHEEKQCKRKILEELMRSAVCGCGFQPGDKVETFARENPEEKIDAYLASYSEILQNPRIIESIAERTYALQDADPGMSNRLKKLGKTLKSGNLNATSLINSLDDTTAGEIARSLAGRIPILSRNLSDLIKTLSGRRLPPQRVMELFKKWLAGADGLAEGLTDGLNEQTLISIEEDSPLQTQEGIKLADWWAFLHRDLLKADTVVMHAQETEALERILNDQFPCSGLKEHLQHMDVVDLFNFLSREKFHTRAIQTGWLILAERILNGSGLLEESEPVSDHANPERASEIRRRLMLCKKIAAALTLAFPERLAVRILIDELCTDPWTTKELKAQAFRIVEDTSSLGEKWLEELAPVSPISLEDKPLVVILDGVSPDLWIASMEKIDSLPGADRVASSKSWARLEADPYTVDALADLFGFKGDPTEEFASRDIPYLSLSGDEEDPLVNHLVPLNPEKPIIIRLGIIDRSAHSGKMDLATISGVLSDVIDKNLPALSALCKEQKRRLVLTTDHGLSSTRNGLTHGKGGVYERTIFRAVY